MKLATPSHKNLFFYGNHSSSTGYILLWNLSGLFYKSMLKILPTPKKTSVLGVWDRQTSIGNMQPSSGKSRDFQGRKGLPIVNICEIYSFFWCTKSGSVNIKKQFRLKSTCTLICCFTLLISSVSSFVCYPWINQSLHWVNK